MPEYPVPKSESQFEENFRQIHPLMKDTEAYYESSRCLFCYNAPCTLACPTRIDVPLFIRQINTGNVAGAARTIYSANYLGGVCGKVCPTEELCEGACVLRAGCHQIAPILWWLRINGHACGKPPAKLLVDDGVAGVT